MEQTVVMSGSNNAIWDGNGNPQSSSKHGWQEIALILHPTAPQGLFRTTGVLCLEVSHIILLKLRLVLKNDDPSDIGRRKDSLYEEFSPIKQIEL